MILLDVNVLVYAHREDSVNHKAYKEWLENRFNSGEFCGLSDFVLSSVLRIVTHPRIFTVPTPLAEAFGFVEQIRNHPNTRIVSPGAAHWKIFSELCQNADVKGNLVADAWHAALAIESGCEWVTTDRDFARFPKLQWRHPLQ